MTPVTDPALLAQLDGSSGLSPVTDPSVLSQLDPQPVTAMGSAKAIATGLVPNFVSGIAGLPGDASKGMDWLFDKFGPTTSPEGQAKLKEFRDGQGYLPTSEDVHSVFAKAGLVHQAQNKTEQHLENISSFVGAGLGGPENVVKNLLLRGVLPGVASDALGTAAEGTAAEAPLRMAGALVAPSGARSVAKAAEAAIPTEEALLQSGREGRDTFRQTPFAVTPQSMDTGFAQPTLRDFGTNRGFTDRTAPETTKLLNEYVGRNASAVTSNDMDELHTLLRGVQQNGGGVRDREAAGAAIAALTDRMTSFDQKRDVLVGSALHTKQTWGDAQGDYAAGMRAGTINDAAEKAKLAAASANSGKNAGNKYKQTFTGVLNSEKKTRGFTDNELNKVESMITDSRWNRLLRNVGNKFGGGGGLGQTLLWKAPALVGAGIGAASGGFTGAEEGGAIGAAPGLALAMLGALSRHGYNRNVARNVAAISQMVRQRSPLAATMVQPKPQTIPSWAQRIILMHQASQVGR